MKNYLILSTDLITINSYIDRILKDNNLDKSCIIKYDYPSYSISSIVEELNTYGFLVENKVIIYTDCSFLSEKIKDSNEIDALEKYIVNPNSQNILILVNEKQDNKLKINKLINENFTIYKNEISIDDRIKESLKDYKMNYVTTNYLINICSNNNERIMNELEKLKLYKLEEKEITINDIDDIVIKNLDDDIFSFINAIVSRNKKKCFELYKNLLNKGEDPVKMVVLIANQFRLIYNCKILINDNMNQDKIANLFNIHSYRVKKAVELSRNFTEEQLLDYLQQLFEIDRIIKTRKGNTNIYFERFLLNL